MQLGKRIRDLRFRRGLTVQQLADASGLSKGFISQVENDRTSPSLATLRDLARALETSIAFLVVEEDAHPHVVRWRDRPKYHFGSNGAAVEILSAQPRRQVEVLMTELPPGTTTRGNRPSDQGEVCVVVVDGKVQLTCGDHSVILEGGDSCHFDGRVPHAFENCGTGTARVLIAATPAVLEPSVRIEDVGAPESNGKPVEVEVEVT